MHKGYIDNTQYKQAFFNGQKIQRIYHNGVLAFESTIRIPFPTVKSVLTYNGKAQTVTFNNYDNKFFTVTGISATNAGTYTAVFQLKEGYGQDVQDDNAMYASYSLKQTINRQKIASKPSISSTVLKYNGGTQNLTSIIVNYDKNKSTLSGTTSSKNAGSYTAYVTPTANYCQSDGSTGKVTLTWKINKFSLAKPYLSGPAKVFAFDGKNRMQTVVNYNSTYMTQSGSTTFIASSFNNTANRTETVKQTLKDSINYCWNNGTSTPVTDSWTVKWVAVGSKNFSGSGAFIVPNNVYQIKVFAVGGGGGVYSPQLGTYDLGMGGAAAGGYTITKTIDVTPGETLSIVIGAGGNGVTQGKNGGAGGTSGVYRNGTPLVEAKGGGNANYEAIHYDRHVSGRINSPYSNMHGAGRVAGANGGSGGGYAYGQANNMTYEEVGTGGSGYGGFNGSNGGDGSYAKQNSQGDVKTFIAKNSGGKGQGYSTKAWGNTGLPYAKGASAYGLGGYQGYNGHNSPNVWIGKEWYQAYPGQTYDSISNSLTGPGSGTAAMKHQTRDYQNAGFGQEDQREDAWPAGEYKENGCTGTVLLKQGQ